MRAARGSLRTVDAPCHKCGTTVSVRVETPDWRAAAAHIKLAAPEDFGNRPRVSDGDLLEITRGIIDSLTSAVEAEIQDPELVARVKSRLRGPRTAP